MPKCKYCNKKATRLHARHDTGELENLCEEHYSKWHPSIAKWSPTKKEIPRCPECGHRLYRAKAEGLVCKNWKCGRFWKGKRGRKRKSKKNSMQII